MNHLQAYINEHPVSSELLFAFKLFGSFENLLGSILTVFRSQQLRSITLMASRRKFETIILEFNCNVLDMIGILAI